MQQGAYLNGRQSSGGDSFFSSSISSRLKAVATISSTSASSAHLSFAKSKCERRVFFETRYNVIQVIIVVVLREEIATSYLLNIAQGLYDCITECS